MGPRTPKNGPNSITAMGLIRAILKTYLVVLSKSGSFDKLGENYPLIVKAISPILDEYKIFAKVLHPLIKFDQKHDGEVIQINFYNGCEFDNLKNSRRRHFIQIRRLQ